MHYSNGLSRGGGRLSPALEPTEDSGMTCHLR